MNVQHILTVLTLGAAAMTGSAAMAETYSFENTDNGNYFYRPNNIPGATFNAQSGVATDTFFAATPPDGRYAAFIQSVNGSQGSISLAFTGLTIGASYSASFYLAPRPNYPPDAVTVSFDGIDLGTYAPPAFNVNPAFQQYTSASFLATATSGTLTFFGAQTTAGDNDTAIDLVTIAGTDTPGAVPEPAAWAMMIVGLGAVGGTLRRRKVTARISYAG